MRTPDEERERQQANELAARLDAHALEPTAGDDPELAALLQSFSRLQTAMQDPAAASQLVLPRRTRNDEKPSNQSWLARCGRFLRMPHLLWQPAVAASLILCLITLAPNRLPPSGMPSSLTRIGATAWTPASSNMLPSSTGAGLRYSRLRCSQSTAGGSNVARRTLTAVRDQGGIRRVKISLVVKEMTDSVARVNEIVSRQQGKTLSIAITQSKRTKVRVQVPVRAVPETLEQIKDLGASPVVKSLCNPDQSASPWDLTFRLNSDGRPTSPGQVHKLQTQNELSRLPGAPVQIDVVLVLPEL